MKTNPTIAVLGAGCFGTAFVEHMRRLDPRARLVVIDSRKTFDQTQRWCFWQPRHYPLPTGTTRVWNNYQYCLNEKPVTRHLRNWSYVHVDSPAYFRHAQTAWPNDPQIEFHPGTRVTDVQSVRGHGYRIETEAGSFLAQRVIDSRSQASRLPTHPLPGKTGWWQSFLGVEIRGEIDHLPLDTFRLMDFGFESTFPLGFGYCLPLSSHRTLVEFTVFADHAVSENQLMDELNRYLHHLHLDGKPILAREKGWLPMAVPSPTAPLQPGTYWEGGIRGTCARPSSGYAYLRSMQQAELFARGCFEDRRIAPAPAPSLFTLLDGVFLETLANHPHLARHCFEQLLGRTSGDQLAAFMAEKPLPGSLFQIVTALPKWPFMKGLFRYAHQQLAAQPTPSIQPRHPGDVPVR